MTAQTTTVHLNNGVPMPLLGLGVYQSDAAQTVFAIKTALSQGYRLIDTAAAYGNEQQVGQAVRESEIDREAVFVTTKLKPADYGYDAALHAFDRSMETLGLDTLDLYLLHWRCRSSLKPRWPPGEPPNGCWRKGVCVQLACAISRRNTSRHCAPKAA
ncbi:aldo/keto reductase [Pseudomonas kermanshahensis]|uniref:Aldo/keto reductase n=1 Tax=Pseudomonas kermanshahensis TaxID=2745482 RepID=A0ABU8R0M7_9PSED